MLECKNESLKSKINQPEDPTKSSLNFSFIGIQKPTFIKGVSDKPNTLKNILETLSKDFDVMTTSQLMFDETKQQYRIFASITPKKTSTVNQEEPISREAKQ